MKWSLHTKPGIVYEPSKGKSQSLWKIHLKKWYKAAGSVFGLLALVTFIGIVIYSIYRPNCVVPDPKTKLFTQKKSPCSVTAGCMVSCTELDENKGDLGEAINRFLAEEACQIKIKLKFLGTKFKDGELTKKWLARLKPELEELEIQKCPLYDIHEGAFEGHPFRNLKGLVFADAELEVLRKQSFLGLGELKLFTYRYDVAVKSIKVERNVLYGMSKIDSLEFSRCALTSQDILHLTGSQGTHLPSLLTLVLYHNDLPYLDGYSFSNASNVQAIHLDHSGLNRINKDAFSKLKDVRRLHLHSNKLITLEEGTLEHLTTIVEGGLTLYYNAWNCSYCPLQWLKNFYLNSNKINHTMVCENGSNFEDVEFCPSTPTPETTTTTTTTTTAAISTTSKSPTCQDGQGLLENPTEVGHTINITVDNKEVEIKFLELKAERLYLRIETSSDLSNYGLVWFDMNNRFDADCLYQIQNGAVLDNMNRDTVYFFTIQSYKRSGLSSSFCLKTQPEWNQRAWIPNNYKNTIIISTTFTVIIIFLLGCLLSFFCLHRFSKLISTKSKVDKSTLTDKDVTTEHQRYCKRCLVSLSQEYLTPGHHYSQIIYEPVQRRYSESSMDKHNRSYVNDQSRYARVRESQIKVEAEVHYEPPPLPPPNPRVRKALEEHYISVT